MLNRTYIRGNITLVTITIFICIYGMILYLKPGIIYNNDGSIRQFGLNSSKKTIIPMWLLSILMAIATYLLVLYYLALPKIMY